MRLQVLAVTMHREDLSIAEQMNMRCDAVVANQADREETITRDTEYGRWHMITTTTRGVGRNRNIGLEAADGDVLLLSDDDVVYRDDMPTEVLRAFAECPQADVMIFGMDMVRDGQVFETRSEPMRRVRVWNGMKYGTCTIGTRTYCAEFKSITCKSKRRSTVSIGIVQQDLGDIAHTQLHLLLGIDNDTLIHICILNLSQRFGELRA